MVAKVAIVNCGAIHITQIGEPEEGFTWINVGDLRIYVCYVSPNIPIIEYDNWLGTLESSIRAARCDVFVAGDFNAKHKQWCSRVNDARGELLLDLAQSLGSVMCNQGNRPTWQRGNSQSHIDITMVSASVIERIANWHVLEEESFSDDFYIQYRIEETKAQIPVKKYTRRNLKRIDPNRLERAIDEHITEMHIDATASDCAETFDRALSGILDKVTPERPVATKRKSVHWWTPQIQQLRKVCNHLRRVYQRKRKRIDADASVAEKEAMKEAKLKLTKLIKRSKGDAWRELCRLVETNPWGRPFKIVMGKLCKNTPIPGINIQGRMESIVEGLFPTPPRKDETNWPAGEITVLVTEDEMK